MARGRPRCYCLQRVSRCDARLDQVKSCRVRILTISEPTCWASLLERLAHLDSFQPYQAVGLGRETYIRSERLFRYTKMLFQFFYARAELINFPCILYLANLSKQLVFHRYEIVWLAKRSRSSLVAKRSRSFLVANYFRSSLVAKRSRSRLLAMSSRSSKISF